MNNKFISAFGSIQNLFQELANDGKIDKKQAHEFDNAQKAIVIYHSWVTNQLENSIKVELPWEAPKFQEAWKLWKDFKNQQFNFSYKPIGEQGALQDLADLSGGDMTTAIHIIHQSIKNSWRGFWPLKNKAITKNLVQDQQTDYKQQLLSRLAEN